MSEFAAESCRSVIMAAIFEVRPESKLEIFHQQASQTILLISRKRLDIFIKVNVKVSSRLNITICQVGREEKSCSSLTHSDTRQRGEEMKEMEDGKNSEMLNTINPNYGYSKNTIFVNTCT